MELLKLIKTGLILGLIFAPISFVVSTINYIGNPYPLFSTDNITVVIMAAIIILLIVLLALLKNIERKRES